MIPRELSRSAGTGEIKQTDREGAREGERREEIK